MYCYPSKDSIGVHSQCLRFTDAFIHIESVQGECCDVLRGILYKDWKTEAPT